MAKKKAIALFKTHKMRFKALPLKIISFEQMKLEWQQSL